MVTEWPRILAKSSQIPGSLGAGLVADAGVLEQVLVWAAGTLRGLAAAVNAEESTGSAVL